ncbi:MAG: hypothetical protein ACRCYO_12250, partial [Bacteroidia bacterium]
MRTLLFSALLFLLMACGPSHNPQQQTEKLIIDTTTTCTCSTDLYAWLKQPEVSSCISCRIGVPKEFSRVAVASNSFGAWLQN